MRRRTFLKTGGSGFLAAGIASLTGISSVAGATTDYVRMKLPSPIGIPA